MLNWAHDNCFVNFPFFGRLVRLKSLLWWPPGIMMFRLCLSILFIVTCSLVNCTNSSKSMFWDNWIYLLKNHWGCSIHGPWTWRSHTSKLSNQPSPLDIVEDRTTLDLLEGKLYFSSEVQGWQFFQVISFDTWRNFLQIGNNFHKKFDITEVKEIDIRKCLLWVLYSPRIRKPYNAKLSPCPGVLITCSCRRNIWFLKTLQSWLSGEREKITLHCLIFPDVAGIQVRIEWLTLSWLWQERMH